MTVTRRITRHWLRGCHCCAANQRGNYECCRVRHPSLFISLCRCSVEGKRHRIRRVKYGQAILILALAIATVCEAQSPLDAPGEKKVIVCSEIARGAAEIFADRYVSKCGMNLACLEARFDELITNSKSRQKDSDGFMLGARTEQVNEIDSVAHNDTRELFNTHEEIVSAYNLCRELRH